MKIYIINEALYEIKIYSFKYIYIINETLGLKKYFYLL